MWNCVNFDVISDTSANETTINSHDNIFEKATIYETSEYTYEGYFNQPVLIADETCIITCPQITGNLIKLNLCQMSGISM